MVDGFSIDLEGRRLMEGGRPIAIRRQSFDLLSFLVRNEGRLLSQLELRLAVWGNRHVSESLLKGCVRDVRKFLRDEPRHPRFIETVPGHGYRFLRGVRLVLPTSHPSPPWTDCLPSVAVLPVTCADGGKDLEHLARVATEEIIGEAAQLSRIGLVETRQISFQDWRKHRARTIGRYLRAQALVLGRLERNGSRLRLHVQLLHAESGRCLWRSG